MDYKETDQDNKGKLDVVKKVRDCLSEAWDHDKDNRRAAADDLEFLAGNQWPDAVRQQREQEGRPILQINRLPQFVRQVSNDIRQADIAIKVVPSDGAVMQAQAVRNPKQEMQQPQGQPGMPPQQPQSNKKPLTMADVFNGLIREIQYQSSASHIYATAAEHQVSCGIGHFRFVTQYISDDSFDQEVRVKLIPNPMSVYWDPASIEVDRSDAQWCVVTQMMPRATFKAKYPKASISDVEKFDDEQGGFYWSKDDRLRIAEFWYKKPVKKKLLQLATGDVVSADEAPPGVPVIGMREVDTHEIVQYLVSGQEILDGPNPWAGRHIPIIPVIGSEIPLDETVVRHGLIRFAKDPQQLYNYARSSAAEVMGQAPKSPWLVTKKMIGAFKSMWDVANKRSLPYLVYTPDQDAPNGPQRQPPPDVPTAYVQEAGVADSDIKATVGIYDPQLGQRSNESSGRAIMAREQQGDTGTFHYSDNLRRALEHAGRVLIDLIPKIYDNDRIIRILGDDDAEMYLPINKQVMAMNQDGYPQPVLMNDLSAGKYDCRVKIGPSYATKRMEAADSMMQFMQAVPQAAPLIGDLIATNMDWPGADAIAERLKRAIPPQVLGEDAPPQPPDPMMEMQQQAAQLQMQMQQTQMQELAAKIEKLTAETEKIYAEIGKTQADTAKTATEAELMPMDREYQAFKDDRDFERDENRYFIDREDRNTDSEANRGMKFEEMRMRNQQPNGSSRPTGESNQ